MKFIDSHCHLNHEQFEADQDEVIQTALAGDVSHLLTISTKRDEYLSLEKISEQYDEIYHTVGVHPHYADETGDIDQAYEILSKACDHPKAIGIGEAGLDYHYNFSKKETQKAFFEMQIDLSIEKDLPLIIHTREADEDTIAMLEQGCKRGNLQAILHCFSSGEALALKGLELGFYVSASGIVTFKKSEALRDIFKQVPLEKLLIETDAPYLAPQPFRGKRNQPAYVRHVAEMMAELKAVSLKEVADQTTANFKRLFFSKL